LALRCKPFVQQLVDYFEHSDFLSQVEAVVFANAKRVNSHLVGQNGLVNYVSNDVPICYSGGDLSTDEPGKSQSYR
jgi:hypothetical protein